MSDRVIDWSQEPLILDADRMCALFGCSLGTLYRRIKIGAVPAWQPRQGKQPYTWYRPDVQKWLEQRRALRRAS
jgi:predicted DNA-binding transcriptional regulator AlpA